MHCSKTSGLREIYTKQSIANGCGEGAGQPRWPVRLPWILQFASRSWICLHRSRCFKFVS